MDSRPPALPLDKYIYNETRYTMLVHSDPEAARHTHNVARSQQIQHLLAAPPCDLRAEGHAPRRQQPPLARDPHRAD